MSAQQTPLPDGVALQRAANAAFPFASAVAKSWPHIIQDLTDGLGPEGMAALAVLLAECVDTQKLRLACRAITTEEDAMAAESGNAA